MLQLFHKPPKRQRPKAVRAYQLAGMKGVYAALQRRPILVMPTGAGKTYTASCIVRELLAKTLWLAHREELIEQAAASLRSHGLSVGIIKAGHDRTPGAQVQVASIQSLKTRGLPEDIELIVVDECHRAIAAECARIVANYPDAFLLGLTATPFRLDGRGLGDMFGEIIVAAYTDELVADGTLHSPAVYAPTTPDLRGVKVTGGDYNLAQLTQRMAPAGEIVEAWKARAAGKRTVCFAIDIEQSREITAAFVAAGVKAEHLDGSTTDRAAILDRLASGATTVISNCMVLTEGWDLPSLECAIIARPTASLNLHLQMIGRIMRSHPGKTSAIVLDHAGNHHVHGLVTRRLSYSLDGTVKVGACDPLGLRQCGRCFVLYDSKLRTCPECGLTPAPAQRAAAADADRATLNRFAEDFEYRRRIWHLIEAERTANDYKPAWSLFRYQDRFGARPLTATIDGVCDLIDPAHATIEQKEAVYRDLMEIVERKGLSRGWASHRYKEAFGCWPKGFVSRVSGSTGADRAAISEKWTRLRGGAR